MPERTELERLIAITIADILSHVDIFNSLVDKTALISDQIKFAKAKPGVFKPVPGTFYRLSLSGEEILCLAVSLGMVKLVVEQAVKVSEIPEIPEIPLDPEEPEEPEEPS